MDLVERLFFAELGVAVVVAVLAIRESIFFWHLSRHELNDPPSWILGSVAVTTWTITTAAIYFGLIASIRLIIGSDEGTALRPLTLISGALIIAVLAMPAYIGYEFRRRRRDGEE